MLGYQRNDRFDLHHDMGTYDETSNEADAHVPRRLITFFIVSVANQSHLPTPIYIYRSHTWVKLIIMLNVLIIIYRLVLLKRSHNLNALPVFVSPLSICLVPQHPC